MRRLPGARRTNDFHFPRQPLKSIPGRRGSSPMQFIKKSPEVYLSQAEIATISHKEIDFLKAAVNETPLKRVRINLHPSSDDGLHEMFIAIQKGSYIRPHKHPSKSEAFHAVHGSAQI